MNGKTKENIENKCYCNEVEHLKQSVNEIVDVWKALHRTKEKIRLELLFLLSAKDEVSYRERMYSTKWYVHT